MSLPHPSRWCSLVNYTAAVKLLFSIVQKDQGPLPVFRGSRPRRSGSQVLASSHFRSYDPLVLYGTTNPKVVSQRTFHLPSVLPNYINPQNMDTMIQSASTFFDTSFNASSPPSPSAYYQTLPSLDHFSYIERLWASWYLLFSSPALATGVLLFLSHEVSSSKYASILT